MNVVYIHGHAASPKCFDFIREQLSGTNEIVMEYDSGHGFASNYEQMALRLADTEDMFFIAHSLGGIYALHLANALGENVLGAVTLSTPYGGCGEAGILQYLVPFNPVLRDIHPLSTPITTANKLSVKHPWTAVVTTRGSLPFMMEKSDGVVTQASMRYRSDVLLVEIPTDHYSVLRDHQTVRLIKEALTQATMH